MAGDEAPTTEAACQDLVEILDEGSGRLDMGRYVDHVRDLSAGAIATFEGTTRDHFDGRRVVELRYEAYGSMARRQLEAILREAHAAHALCRLAVAHRLGTVPAGEASMFVAAAGSGFGSERRWLGLAALVRGGEGREDRATWVRLRGGGIDGCRWISEHPTVFAA
ncbi:molybdopterin synthase catalytic subunit-like [Hordeum vulgare subsp. vulgare]|uniref:molybdopterin synthase catalytic subunit-like n=1 Tax=Hordeum vulgare subsp. vulgare TaxID=112509 RepID=UPI001D1A49DA|nr:molybdopterin synthase catalytic subunit-like [Hordeum vulgare subsp. vulgare]